MIRPATLDDIDRLVDLGEMMHRESTFRAIAYSIDKVRCLLARLIRGDGVVFVAEINGVVIGGLAGAVTEYWFSHERIAFDYAFFLEPGHRHGMTALKLIAAMEAWGVSQKARELQLGITTGVNVEALSKFYERIGYRNAGPIFKKEL